MLSQHTDLFAVVVLVPVLSVVDVVQVPAGRKQRTKAALSNVLNVITVAAPHLNDRIRLQLFKQNHNTATATCNSYLLNTVDPFKQHNTTS